MKPDFRLMMTECTLEKIMENVKHIEVQVFRDNFGKAVSFLERDCLDSTE